MATQYRFKHLRSSVQGKAPKSEQIEKGEIAINFYEGEEFLTIKNSGDNIVKFRPEEFTKEFTQNAIKYDNLLDGTNQGLRNWSFSNGDTNSVVLTSFVDSTDNVEGFQLTYTQNGASGEYGWEVFTYDFDYTQIKQGVNYTFSFDFKSSSAITLGVNIINSGSEAASKLATNIYQHKYLIEEAGEWKHFDIELNGVKDGTEDSWTGTTPCMLIAVIQGNVTPNEDKNIERHEWQDAQFKNLKLIVGTKPTVWKESFKDSLEKAGVADISADIIALSGQVNTLSGDVSDVKTTANNNGTAISLINANIAAINEWQGLRESEITSLQDAARNLEDNVKTLSGDVSELQSEVSGLTDNIDKLESDLTKTNESIDTLTTEVENTEKVIAGAFEKVSESCGLNEGLQYQASATSNYVSAANSLAKAIEILDSELKKVSDNSNSVPDDVATKTDLNAVIESTVSKADFNAFTGTTATKNELNALSGATVAKTEFDDYKVQLDEAFLVLTQTLHKFKEVYGLNEELTFKPAANTQYISNATSVADALNKLDLALQQITNTSNE